MVSQGRNWKTKKKQNNARLRGSSQGPIVLRQLNRKDRRGTQNAMSNKSAGPNHDGAKVP